jgi:hypothetical protein
MKLKTLRMLFKTAYMTVNINGTQQAIALLKLLVERGGMYNQGGNLSYIASIAIRKCSS